MLSLTPKKIDVNKARRLVLELHSAPEEIKKMIIDKIETTVNKSVETGRKLEIKEIFINPQPVVNGSTIKRSNPNLRRGQAKGTIITNVKSVLKAPERTSVVGSTETTIIPNPPNIRKARVVEESKRPPFVSERTKRERLKKQQREEEERKKAERAQLYRQLSLFQEQEDIM